MGVKGALFPLRLKGHRLLLLLFQLAHAVLCAAFNVVFHLQK